MMEIREIKDKETWNTGIMGLKNPHILQTWEWGQIKAQTNWAASYYFFYKEEILLASALILARRLPVLNSPVLYCPRGPLFFEDSQELYEEVLEQIDKIAQKKKAVSLKIDPDASINSTLWTAALTCKKWIKGKEIQFRNTALLNVLSSEEDQLALMKPKTRYNIRLAGRKGVEVSLSDSREDLETFFDIYWETGNRNGFVTRTKEYYMRMAETYQKAGMGYLFVGCHEGEILTGAFILVLGDRCWYFYGASRSYKRNIMSPVLLQHEIVRWAASKNLSVYDMWGAPEILDESDSMFSVYKFKEGLGADFTEQCGAYDKVLRPFPNWLVTIVFPRLQKLKRKILKRG